MLMLGGTRATLDETNVAGPVYVLRLFLPDDLPKSVITAYENRANENREAFLSLGRGGHADSGFDLLCPTDSIVQGAGSSIVDMGVYAKMTRVDNDKPLRLSAYYLYPRSSTGVKTPLRLANSVGVIDSGYRGSLKAAFDNRQMMPYKIRMGERLVQICAPDLGPLYVELIEGLTPAALRALQNETRRGAGGFGSTGS